MAGCSDVNFAYLKKDGTVSGLAYSDSTNYITLDPSCCTSLGYSYDNTLNSCVWNTNDDNSVKLILNPVSSGGAIFTGDDSISYNLDVKFSYLLEFNSTEILSYSIDDIFNNIYITSSIERVDTVNNTGNIIYEDNEILTTIYSSDVLKITDIVSYINSNTDTGLRVIGSDIGNVKNALISYSNNTIKFNDSSLNSCWLTHSFTISDTDIIDSIIDKKIKLGITVNSVNTDFSLLLDNISMTKSYEELKRVDKKIVKCPGFNLSRVVDNKKSWVYINDNGDTREYSLKRRETFYKSSDSGLVINTKEIDLQIDPALAIEQAVYSYIKGNEECLNISGPVDTMDMFTTEISTIDTAQEFLRTVKSELINAKERKILNKYPSLRSLYDNYMKLGLCGVTSKLTYSDLIKYSKKLNKNWVDIIEQLIPATSIWGSANIYRNTVFDDNKFKYRSYSLVNCNTGNLGTPAIGSVTSGIEVIYNDISIDNQIYPKYTCGSLYITDLGSNPEYRVVNTGFVPAVEEPFIFEINTNNVSSLTFTLPLRGGMSGEKPYDFEVNYGDSDVWYEVDSYFNDNKTHTYQTHGVYNISIRGKVGGLSFKYGGNKLIITKVLEWGNCEFARIDDMFSECSNLTEIPSIGGIYAPNAVNGRSMFDYCIKLDIEIPNDLFRYCGKIESLRNAFGGCTKLKGSIPENLFSDNKNLKELDIVFSACFELSGSIPNNLFYNNKNLTNLSYAFFRCKKLSGSIPHDLFHENTNVNNFTSIFQECGNLTGNIPHDLFSMNKEVVELHSVFNGCTGLTGSIPELLFSENVNATGFSYTFAGCIGLSDSIPDSLFSENTEAIQLNDVFRGCTGLTGSIPPILFSNNSKIKYLGSAFYGCGGLTGPIPPSLFSNNTELIDIGYVFNGCGGLTGSIPPSLFSENTELINMRGVFNGCGGLTGSIPSSLFSNNTKVTNISSVFGGCTGLTGTILPTLFSKNTELIDMGYVFNACSGLTGAIPSLLFSNNTKVTTFSYIFSDCVGLSGNIPDLLFNNNTVVTNFGGLFYKCNGLVVTNNIFTTHQVLNVKNWNRAFLATGNLGGTAQEIWVNSSATDFSNCFSGRDDLTNYNDIPNNWKGL